MRCPRALPTASAVLASSLLVGVASAAAVTTINVDVWTGKPKSKKLAASIDNDRSNTTASVNLSVACKGPDGKDATYELNAQGKIKSGKLKLNKSKAYNGTSGTLKVSAKLPRTTAATGTFTWTLPDSLGSGCSGHDSFKLKHILSHGG